MRGNGVIPDVTKEEFAVLSSGTVTMGIEILAGRILAPDFGSSIYTWGSIIGVFMTALAIGYFLGGKRAEENASYQTLAILLLESAAFIAAIIVLSEQIMVLSKTMPVGARYVTLLPTALLFGPPVFLLGFISPFAAELSKENGTGAASGRVYAVGTIGSIIGAFATTFVLIPLFRVESIELLFGGILVAGAVLLSFRNKVVTRETGYAFLVTALLVSAFILQVYGVPARGLTGEQVVYQTQTPYQQLAVKDHHGIRVLYLNNQPQSAMYLNGSDRAVWRYTKYFHLPFLLQDNNGDIKNVLFIGGGGFTGPKRFLQDYNVNVDVVEIDPDVVRTAKRFFNVSESERLHIHVMDGRRYLQQTNQTYDLIVLDAYHKDSVPFHLTTKEFMQLAETHLTPHGMLLANLISAQRGPASKFYRAEYRTMNQVFPSMYAFPTARMFVTQNIELIASKNPNHLSQQDLYQRNKERDIGINLSREIASYAGTVSTKNAPILTDDKAPVDKLLNPVLGTTYVIEGQDQAKTW